MLSNRLAFGALAVGCLAAAAGGGYLASRQNAVPAPAAAEASPAAVATPSPAPAPSLRPVRPVQETEAVVGNTATGDAAKAPSSPSGSAPLAPKTAAARRVDLPARTSTATSTRQDQTPAPTTSPSGSTSQPPATLPAPNESVAAPRPDERAERAAQEPPRAPEPPQKTFEELLVPADSVIGLQTENRISSETARVEDRLDARVTRDVRVGDRVAIPAGSRVLGSVMVVERGGKFKEKARLGVRFHTLVLADGARLPIATETIYRDGEAPGNASAARVGGAAVGGAILGAILGGSKGAAIGSAAGAGAGAAAVVAGDKNAATLPPGTPMTVRILSPITVTTEK